MRNKHVKMGLMMTTCDMKARGMPPYERPKERRNITQMMGTTVNTPLSLHPEMHLELMEGE